MMTQDNRQNGRGVFQYLVWSHGRFPFLWVADRLSDAFRVLEFEQIVAEDVGLLEEVLLACVVLQRFLFFIGNWDSGQLS